MCLGRFKCEKSNHIIGQVIFKFDPYVQKFHIHLLSKTLVSKIDQKNDLLSMESD